LSSQKRKTRGSPSGRLRIVAGKWRSRLLPVADVEGLRPTSERVRETLFNWLTPFIEGASCLDLFAGTGALGYEALSRGARSADLVENAPAAVAVLREILRSRGIRKEFDIVFLDPPFVDDRYEELCRLLAERSWLSRGAHVYLEQDRNQPVPELPQGWQLQREKTAGNVRYSLISVAN